MTINRRSALGAMIGGAVAGPSAAKSAIDAASSFASEGIALKNVAHAEAAKMVASIPSDVVATLKRIASGDFTDEDYNEGTWRFSGFFCPQKIVQDHDADLAVLKSVSLQARRVLVHNRQLADSRRRMMQEAMERLLSLGL